MKIAFAIVLTMPLALAGFFTYNNVASAATPPSDTVNIACSGSITSSLQSAINAANDGTIISIGSGSCTGGSVSWTNKNITVQGQGIDVTTVSGLSFNVTDTTKANFRISGMTVGAAAAWKINAIDRTTGIKGWRVDHIKWSYPNCGQNIALQIDGINWGLLDNNQFINAGNAIFIRAFAENTNEVNPWPPSGNPGMGGNSWLLPLNLGTDEAVYVEDNTFTMSNGCYYGIGDSYYGGRTVFRYNNVTNAYWQNHAARGYERGGITKAEIYNNDFNAIDSAWYRAIHMRSGTGVIFNNSLRGYFNTIQVDNQRSNGQNTSAPFGACSGSSGWDGNNSGQAGWPCLDQIGRGPGQYPNQPSVPLYGWNNGSVSGCSTGGSCNNNLSIVGDGDNHVQSGRDFINNGTTAKPGYTTYTYPHPLQGGVTPTPTPPPTPLPPPVVPPPPPTNQPPVGSFDEITSTGVVRGWSYDPTSSSTAIQVHVYIDGTSGQGGTLLSGFATNIMRTDVNNTYGISGTHGYEYTIPQQYWNGAQHSIRVYAVDTTSTSISILLTGSPRNFTLSVPVTPQPQPSPSPAPAPNPTPSPTPAPGGGGGGNSPSPTPNPSPTPVRPEQYPSGTIFKYPNSPTVYIKEGTIARPITDWTIYLNNVPPTRPIITVPSTVTFTQGQVLGLRSGTLVRASNDTTVYLIVGNEKRPFTSESEFANNAYRFDQVYVINDPNLITSIPTTSAPFTRPIRTLFKYPNDSTVYFLNSARQKRPFTTWNMFRLWVDDPKNVITVPASETYPDGAIVTLPNGSLVKGTGATVYLVDQDKLRPFNNSQLFATMGYKFEQIITVTDAELNLHQSGSAM